MTTKQHASFLAALGLDLAYSSNQVKRHFGLDLPEAVALGAIAVSHFVGFNQWSPRQPVTFVVSRRAHHLNATQLRHLAGTAELRFQLRALPAQWKTQAFLVGDVSKPDALWFTSAGVVPVEFDAGAYNTAQIATKRKHFEQHIAHIWGTTSALRRERLVFKLRSAKVQVVQVNWL